MVSALNIDLSGFVTRQLQRMSKQEMHALAHLADCAPSTVEKIGYGVVQDAGVSTMQKLANALLNHGEWHLSESANEGRVTPLKATG